MPTPKARDGISRSCASFATLLTGIAGWTVLIKFVLPVLYAAARHERPATYVMWDLWWAVHLALAAALRRRPAGTWSFALFVSVAEIGIVVTKLAVFLQAPDPTFFKLNWLVNKMAVLGTFVALLLFLLREDVRRRLDTPAVRST